METSKKVLSNIITYMKYAKYLKDKNRRENWEELVFRNKEMHKRKYPHLENEIDEAYNLVLDKKILPSMRSMQFSGKPIELSPNRIFNCSYLPIDDWRSFSEIMFLLLSGCGVGFSVQKHHVDHLPEISKPNVNKRKRFLVGDSIEGWAESIRVLMKSYFRGGSEIEFDYRDIRAKGSLLITSGGKAPGPQPLKECILKIKGILDAKNNNDKLRPIELHDIVCHIADAVLAGGIRRAALISLFSADDDEMMSCKSGNWWELNPQRGRSNNSVVLVRYKIRKDYFMKIWERVKESRSGEPGIFFTNDKNYGTNPCAEIALKSNQFCNLVEVNVDDVENQEDLNNRVKKASFISTLQAGYTDFHYLRENWKKTTEKEALLGVSMTGIASGKVLKLNIEEAAHISVEENRRVSNLIGINNAARINTIKPSGTASSLLGTSSGIHAWHSNYYIRRIRVGKNEAIYTYLSINYPDMLEDDYFRPHDTAIISIPQKAPDGSILRNEESSIDLLERVKKIHTEWINPGHIIGSNTHNVSCTVSIKDDEWEEVGEWMWKNRSSYTAISVLPYDNHTYKQAPFEEITKEQYEGMISNLRDINLDEVIETFDNTDLRGELACSGNNCEIV